MLPYNTGLKFLLFYFSESNSILLPGDEKFHPLLKYNFKKIT